MRATAHAACCWYVPTIHMLVWHTFDDYSTASSSSEVSRSCLAHPSSMTCTTLEWHDIEVSMAVCMAGMIAVLSRVAAACRTAPWSEDMTCLSHDASSAAFRCQPFLTASNFLNAVVRAV